MALKNNRHWNTVRLWFLDRLYDIEDWFDSRSYFVFWTVVGALVIFSQGVSFRGNALEGDGWGIVFNLLVLALWLALLVWYVFLNRKEGRREGHADGVLEGLTIAFRIHARETVEQARIDDLNKRDDGERA